MFGGEAGSGTGWRAVAAGVVAFIAFMLLAVLSALVAIAVLAMPVIVRTVAERDFPALERRRGGTFAGSIANAVITLGVFVPAWLASLAAAAVAAAVRGRLDHALGVAQPADCCATTRSPSMRAPPRCAR